MVNSKNIIKSKVIKNDSISYSDDIIKKNLINNKAKEKGKKNMDPRLNNICINYCRNKICTMINCKNGHKEQFELLSIEQKQEIDDYIIEKFPPSDYRLKNICLSFLKSNPCKKKQKGAIIYIFIIILL